MIRKLFFIATTTILILSLFAGIVSALDTQAGVAVKTDAVKANLENVRAYAAAAQSAGLNYAVDGGALYSGRPGEWRKVATPDGVIVGAVAVDSSRPGRLYIGAANELAIYRTDGNQKWLRVPLSNDYVGGVTSLALDKASRLLYVGTDTAGVFRLRDVGASMLAGGHVALSEPVLQVATDSSGAGLVFARTPSTLYHGENMGLNWNAVENLGSTPTALAVVNRYPATVYVGTADRGLLTSQDGAAWSMANDGLAFVPGSRLSIDAIAADPAQLDVLYVATSYLYGTTTVHQSPAGIQQTTNGGATWQTLQRQVDAPVAELLPVAGQTGAVYALTLASRQPLPIGAAPALVEPAQVVTAIASNESIPTTTVAAWLIAVLAALALGYALMSDLRSKTAKPAPATVALRAGQR
ncbi:MAG TPA: hypothetical protein DCL15_15985 [Chloroflexi bacterium]|nr:hypothetical protein [Chloroflexota bacterium]HHW86508.1 hypothetical protein [Chloroflexota bacterium]